FCNKSLYVSVSLFPSLWFPYPNQNLSLKYHPTFKSDNFTLSEFLFAPSSILHFLVYSKDLALPHHPSRTQLTHTCTCTVHYEAIPYTLHVVPLPQFG
uniref:Uncharacterized protein n=1 Tax=Serinus canaria TaxID=9135 RepID=A0A8C9U4B8_SERCA